MTEPTTLELHRWSNEHASDCPVTDGRTSLLAEVTSMDERVWHGCVVEWDRDGDEEGEHCTCGAAPSREEFLAAVKITTADATLVREGNTVFSHYTCTWGVIQNITDWNGELWFDFVEEGGKKTLLNGERVCATKPAWMR